MTAEGEERFRQILEAKVRDPELRRKLTPAYPLGCKRTLFSDDWFDALQRPNVEVIDTAVAAIEPGGVRTRDGQLRKVDAVIYGTGFTPTDYLTPMHISGLAGRDLNQAWRDGAEAYFGITVAGFPNFFMLYGPNTNVVGSIVFMLESQAHYVVQCIKTLARRGARSMTVRDEAQRRFNQEVQRRIAGTVMVKDTCHSYFRDPSGKVTTNWPGFMSEYRLRTRRVRTGDYAFATAGAPTVQTSPAASPVVRAP
jgi:cation diffusion facilitator CzcD-associated flavoprotein CzcO